MWGLAFADPLEAPRSSGRTPVIMVMNRDHRLPETGPTCRAALHHCLLAMTCRISVPLWNDSTGPSVRSRRTHAIASTPRAPLFTPRPHAAAPVLTIRARGADLVHIHRRAADGKWRAIDVF